MHGESGMPAGVGQQGSRPAVGTCQRSMKIGLFSETGDGCSVDRMSINPFGGSPSRKKLQCWAQNTMRGLEKRASSVM